MNKKLIIASIGVIMSFGAFADAPTSPNAGGRGGMMSNLTDEQKSCIAQYGCAKPEKIKGDKKAKGEKPEMSADQKESMECMKNAMTACGIEMPAGDKAGKKRQGK